ncbi:MAG: DUF58 domain-containing protein [Anaerolineales bacterium]|nr:DUF58 domain-containing protein [Anaerolineales bacterium]
MGRLALVGALVYLLIFWGLTAFQPGLLVLAILLVVYLGAAILFHPTNINLRVERTISPTRAHVHTPVTVHLVITNLGANLAEVHIQDVIPARLQPLEGASDLLTELKAGQTIDMTYTLSGERGIFEFTALRIVINDRLSLFQRTILAPAAGQLFLLPNVPPLKRVAIRPRQTRVYAGSIPSRQGGPGVDFYGVREFQPGDSLNQVNWRLSARYPGSLFSNAYEHERVANVWIILDARKRSDIQVNGEALFEHAVMAAASLGQALLQDGNRVGLLVYGSYLDRTFPGYGYVQNERILRALARAQPGESMVFDQLENLPTRLFPLHSQLIVISPLHSDDLHHLVRLRARGYALITISPDPITFELASQQTDPYRMLAARLTSLERQLLKARLLQAGVQVYDWDVSIPFHQALNHLLSRAMPGYVGQRGRS